jgi:hypothetical protein
LLSFSSFTASHRSHKRSSILPGMPMEHNVIQSRTMEQVLLLCLISQDCRSPVSCATIFTASGSVVSFRIPPRTTPVQNIIPGMFLKDALLVPAQCFNNCRRLLTSISVDRVTIRQEIPCVGHCTQRPMGQSCFSSSLVVSYMVFPPPSRLRATLWAPWSKTELISR